MSPALILLVGAAIASSLAHLFVDVFIGLFGSGKAMSFPQALLLFAVAALYGWWPVAFVMTERREPGGPAALLLLCGLWAALGNGVAGLVGCPPPCANAFPYQDLTHVASLVFGAAASYAIWRAHRGALTFRARWPVTAIALVLAVIAAGALLALTG